MRDPETGNSRGFGFISYDSFEASDAAIEVIFFLSNCYAMLVLADYFEEVHGRGIELEELHCKYNILPFQNESIPRE